MCQPEARSACGRHLPDPAGCGLEGERPQDSAAPPRDLLLHGQQLGVHALLPPLHQLHVRQELGDAVLANLYVLVLQGGHLGPRGGAVTETAPQRGGEGRGHPGKGRGAETGPCTAGGDRGGPMTDSGEGGPTGRGRGTAPGGQEGQRAQPLTLGTFLLMFSRSRSWPRRKQGCWNSVSSRSGLTRPPCSMWTTFRKPSARRGWGGRAASGPGRRPALPPLRPCPQHPHTAPPPTSVAVAAWGFVSFPWGLGPGPQGPLSPGERSPGPGPQGRWASPSAQRGSASVRRPPARRAPPGALTHVQLPHEAGHVVVLEVLGQHLLGKLALVEHVEAVPALQETRGRSHTPAPWDWAARARETRRSPPPWATSLARGQWGMRDLGTVSEPCPRSGASQCQVYAHGTAQRLGPFSRGTFSSSHQQIYPENSQELQ